MAGIARAAEVSERWLQKHVNRLYAHVARKTDAKPRKGAALTLDRDELWSFVGNKANKQWVWPALGQGHPRHCRRTHRRPQPGPGAGTLGFLARSLPRIGGLSTDYWEAYRQVFPEDRHVASGKDSGQTNPIERFNNTLRHRVSRLVRKSLAFSKKLENPIGAIWYFVHHYNTTKLAF